MTLVNLDELLEAVCSIIVVPSIFTLIVNLNRGLVLVYVMKDLLNNINTRDNSREKHIYTICIR